MSCQKRLDRAFAAAPLLPLWPDSRYVLMSDCHRGAGQPGDNFLKNEPLYLAALTHYFQRGFTYIELGDGDELWENRSLDKIKEIHSRSFELLSRYFASGRMHGIYGNHDIVKRNPAVAARQFGSCSCSHSLETFSLCPGIIFHEGIILQDKTGGRDIYLTHGHQADILNSTLWRLSRFLVRYVWHPLEKLGIPDPTSAAKNNTKKKKSEERLTAWARENGHILITGHTHHPMSGTKDSPYLNTGSCVHPAGITAIEIENRCMTLVKWTIDVKEDMTLYAAREVLADTICIDDY